MYTEAIENYVKTNHWIMTDNEHINRYIHICRFYKENSTKSTKYNFHHIFPSFVYKIKLNEKNRYHIIKKLDKDFDPLSNVVKLPIEFHIKAHYHLALGLVGTIYEKDAVNSFCTLVGDYNKSIFSYTEQELDEIAKLVEENSQPSVFDHYLTTEERKEKYKEFQEQNRKQWEENHKEEIEERKMKQKEYRKQQWKKQKEYFKNK